MRIYIVSLIIDFNFCFLLEYITLQLFFFYFCLDLADLAKKLHDNVTETKDMVKEIHQVIKGPDNCQSASMTIGDRTGTP